MAGSQIVNESQLDGWVRGNAALAQGTIVELIWRLVCASCPKPTHRRYPLGDSIGQHGADGDLDVAIGFDPFVPEGKSIWEVGSSVDAKKKANKDYKDSTSSTPEEVRRETTFVFVTPLSGRRDWKDTWKTDGIETWVTEKKKLGEWRDIRVLDGCQLTDWLCQFPAVGYWFGSKVNQTPDDYNTVENYWKIVSSYGAPPSLASELFTVGRGLASEKLKRLIVDQNDGQLRLDTRYPQHLKSFVSAFVATLNDGERAERQSKVLILPSSEAFKQACSLNEAHVFIVDFDLDAHSGHELIQRAISRRHAVIYAAPPGGPPHGNSCELHTPNVFEMKEALVKSGYSEERARTLTNRSGRDLNALLRLIQNLSAMPEWATQSEASDLAIAQLIGQWEESFEGDKQLIEELSGKTYGEWIVGIQKAASTQAAPLDFYNGRWKFSSRYEPWMYLGKLIGTEVLERFEQLAVSALSESDPALDLPKDKRHAVSIFGEKPQYSKRLREGISETLALLGADGEACSLCPDGLPRQVTWRVVDTLLEDADSLRWASLNSVLPLLAEAAPDAFLNAVGGASEQPDEPFSGVFAEEGDGFLGGGSYMTGLLWALESLAWSSDYLLRVSGILANLASVDPGGNWSNRPSNSLVTIFLPWLPQTAADTERRHAALKYIMREQPDVAWDLLVGLLPKHHSTSSHTHRPKWQNFIPEDWKDGATYQQRWKDEAFYGSLALELAGTDIERLEKLLPFFFYINPDFAEAYRQQVCSDAVLEIPEETRLKLWSAVNSKLNGHRKFRDSDAWRVPKEDLKKLERIADTLKPTKPEILHKQLFAGHGVDLFEEKGNWEEQRERLLQRRIKALREISDLNGIEGLRRFWRSVSSPNDAGNAYAADTERADDSLVLPAMLDTGNNADQQFVLSYIWRRYYQHGLEWVDAMDRSGWSANAKVQFFSYLPFVNEIWKRVAEDLSDDEPEYWKSTRVHLENDHLENIDFALNKLIENDRPDDVINCLWLGKLWGGEYSEIGLRSLETFNDQNHVDAYAIGEVFNHLQEDKAVDEDRLATMEAKFLELLDEFNNAHAVTLYRHLAERPEFFCEVISMVYRSKNSEETEPEQVPDEDGTKAKIAARAYQLLSDWNHSPGLCKNGEFDVERLREWVTEVRSVCEVSGRWEVAAHHIGEVFYYAPTDEGDLWVEPVCELLDSKDGEEYRRGLGMRIYNSRGVHGFSGGKEELELAEKWEQIATAAENKGFVRLGASLRELGKGYRSEAERSVQEHRHMFD